MDTDEVMIDWCLKARVPLHVLLTKADKLAFGASKNALQQVRTRLQQHEGEVSVQLFSAMKPQGVDELRDQLDTWLTAEEEEEPPTE